MGIYEDLKPLAVKVQNVVAAAAFNQTFDLDAIANAYPQYTEFKGRFPGIVFRLNKPKTVILIFKTGKMVCTGAKSEEEARKAIFTTVQKLKNGGINVTVEPQIQITNIVASAIIGDFIDLEKFYMSEMGKMRGKIVFESEQFPALIYRLEDPEVVFLIFSTGKVVCAGAKKTLDIHEAVEKLQQRLEENEVLIKS